MTSEAVPGDTAVIDPVPIRVLEARRIEARYGATAVWFGYFTRRWWALVDLVWLVEGKTPDRLGEAIVAARKHGLLRAAGGM
ncbi:hypothetical protein GCM10010402_71600 [Actinomadura luteofluorescens]|uniref:hypothetical protein n=1 Tax=Actinomadura luteofluorescens TaxID=46163 RepID=UPI0031D6D2F2